MTSQHASLRVLGKYPTEGDYIRFSSANELNDFIESFVDRGMKRGYELGKVDAMIDSPRFVFFLSPTDNLKAIFVGGWVMSRDAYGRIFPLTLGIEFPIQRFENEHMMLVNWHSVFDFVRTQLQQTITGSHNYNMWLSECQRAFAVWQEEWGWSPMEAASNKVVEYLSQDESQSSIENGLQNLSTFFEMFRESISGNFKFGLRLPTLTQRKEIHFWEELTTILNPNPLVGIRLWAELQDGSHLVDMYMGKVPEEALINLYEPDILGEHLCLLDLEKAWETDPSRAPQFHELSTKLHLPVSEWLLKVKTSVG